MEGFAGIILRHLRNIKYGIRQAQEEEPAPRLRPQARPPGRQAQRCEHLAALQVPYRCEERRKGCSAAGDKTKASELFAKAQSIVDTVADKGIFHKNKAARDKSRLSAKVKALALAPEKAVPPDTCQASPDRNSPVRRLIGVRCSKV
jgi:hypothetical protein